MTVSATAWPEILFLTAWKRLSFSILKDPLYAPEDEKFSARLNKWAKAQALKGLALASKLKNPPGKTA